MTSDNVGIVWIEHMWDRSGYWLKLDASERYPEGKSIALHEWRSIHDGASLAEVARVLGTWGLKYDGIGFQDESGKQYITISPSA